MGTSDPDFARYAGANSEESAAWRKGLSPEELDAVSSYSSQEFTLINNLARGLPLPDITLTDPATKQPMPKAEVSKYAQMQSDRLSSALDKSRTAVPMLPKAAAASSASHLIASIPIPPNNDKNSLII